MMKRKWLWLPTAAVALTMAACGSKTTNTTTTTEGADKSKFVSEVTHDGEPIKGGTLKYAIVSSSPINGLFIDELSSDSNDAAVAGMIDESMFEYDDNRKLVNSGLASISFDVEGKTATVKLNSQDYKWSDGEKVTIDDYIFTYEGIGHKDYTGVRYDGDFKNIEGMDEYHKGTASTISGLEKLDDYTVKIHYKEMTPSMQLAGGSVSSYIMPKHIFSKIPVAEWEQSDYVRGKSNVGLGAFTIESMVPGESVTFAANPNYYKGRPNLDKVVMEVVSPDSIVSEMKAGKYDIASMPSSQYDSFKDLTNVTFVSSLESAYEYIGFKLGKWDKEQGKNVVDPNAKMSDVALRQAIAYAIDPDTAGKNLYNGLQHGTNSIIIPFFKDIYNKNQEGFDYNPEKAKKLLDDAGYKDVDGDGFVEKPDGSKLELNFVIYTSREELKVYAQAAQANLKDVGINVNLKTVSYETLLDMRDSGNFDLLIWNVLAANTGDPEKYLYENWDSSSASNQAGYKNAKVDELLDKLNVEFDPEKRKDLAIEIQQLIMNDAATVFFGYETTFLYSNKKVQNLKMFPMDYYWLTKDVTVSE